MAVSDDELVSEAKRALQKVRSRFNNLNSAYVQGDWDGVKKASADLSEHLTTLETCAYELRKRKG